ncbi:MAG TPA: LppX_LprAFG lipoprotein [Roseiflexaceae bacterium]|nr:LppX_LprAFG lipoprotein [Roseiflexaceae bacterium]
MNSIAYHSSSRWVPAVLLGLLLLAGCGGGEPPPAPDELAAAAGRATHAAQSLRFSITIEGARVYTDDTRLFSLSRVEGQLQRPDGALATLRARSLAGVAEIRTVSLAGRQYFTNPVTRAWQCLAPGTGFDPVILFDAERGLEQLLQQQYTGVTLVGEETIDGRATYHLRGQIAGAALAAISGDRIGGDMVQADVWADRSSMQLVQIVLVSGAEGAQPSTWTLRFSGYDEPVDLRAPVEC